MADDSYNNDSTELMSMIKSQADLADRLVKLSKEGDLQTLEEFRDILKHSEFNPNEFYDDTVLWHVVLKVDSSKEQWFARDILTLPNLDFKIRNQNDRGDSALHLLARERPYNNEALSRKTVKLKLLISCMIEWTTQQDESRHCQDLGELMNALSNFNQTAAHNLLEDYRSIATESVGEQLQIFLDTDVLMPLLKDNTGTDLLICAVNHKNQHAVQILLNHFRKNGASLPIEEVKESLFFSYAFLLKVLQLSKNQKLDEAFVSIKKSLVNFYYDVFEKKISSQSNDIPIDKIMAGLVQACLRRKYVAGQVELIAQALGKNVKDTSRSQLLVEIRRSWFELMCVCVREERDDILEVISCDPDLTNMIRSFTPQQLSDLYAECAGEHSALFSIDSIKTGGRCVLEEFFKLLTLPERRPEEIPTAVVFPPCHQSFPFVCLVLGKFKLLRTYFSIFSLPECFPQGVFVAWMARLLIKHGHIASQEMEKNLIEVVSAVDKIFCENINTITQHNVLFDELLQPIFFDTRFSCLGKKTLLEVAISGRCGVFLRTKMCREHLEREEGSLLRMKDDCTALALLHLSFRLAFLLVQPFVQILKILCLIPCIFINLLIMPAHAIFANQRTAGTFCARFVGIPLFINKLNEYQLKVVNPMIKFYLDLISTAVFLVLLSLLVTRHLHHAPGYFEIAVLIFGGCYALEEIRTVIYHARDRTLPQYINDLWNIADMVAFFSLLCAVSTRAWLWFGEFSLQTTVFPARGGAFEESRDLGLFCIRVFYMFALLLFHIKFLRVASLWENLGVKLKMIYHMIVHDLVPFLLILGMVLAAFGCVFVGLLYPNGIRARDSVDEGLATSWFVGSQTLLYSFYALAGEMTVLQDSASACTEETCPHPIGSKMVSLFFLVLFVVLANILLLNLLIGLFSATIERVQGQAYELWFSDRALLKYEYTRRSVMPPPFNIADIVADILCWLVTKMKAVNISENPSNFLALQEKEEHAALMLTFILAWSSRGRKRITFTLLQQPLSSPMITENSVAAQIGKRLELVACKRGLSSEELIRLVEQNLENSVL